MLVSLGELNNKLVRNNVALDEHSGQQSPLSGFIDSIVHVQRHSLVQRLLAVQDAGRSGIGPGAPGSALLASKQNK